MDADNTPLLVGRERSGWFLSSVALFSGGLICRAGDFSRQPLSDHRNEESEFKFWHRLFPPGKVASESLDSDPRNCKRYAN